MRPELKADYREIFTPSWRKLENNKALLIELILHFLLCFLCIFRVLLPNDLRGQSIYEQRKTLENYFINKPDDDDSSNDDDSSKDVDDCVFIHKQYRDIIDRFQNGESEYIDDNNISITHNYYANNYDKNQTIEHYFVNLKEGVQQDQPYGRFSNLSLADDEQKIQIRQIWKDTQNILIKSTFLTRLFDYGSLSSVLLWDAEFEFQKYDSGIVAVDAGLEYQIYIRNKNEWTFLLIGSLQIVLCIISIIFFIRTLLKNIKNFKLAKEDCQRLIPPVNWNKIPFSFKFKFFDKWSMFIFITTLVILILI
ncbi:MAG: hypothetical protein EZS28_022371 [Streblomastix strix]|uniref:Transmembrane protein n=1 Tax=Streblomastix strix TaxID=222440 RepID=A0A5J4VHP1_9EUKA|nr:MAG: hypothetical protein EZS28_022371 [Streblomastix strix]